MLKLKKLLFEQFSVFKQNVPGAGSNDESMIAECFFCGFKPVSGFDKEGYKYHLLNYCKEFDKID